MKLEKTYYTYELIDPRNNKPFYIGKGKKQRMYYHYNTIKNNKTLINKHLENKLKQLLKEKLEPIYIKILKSNDEKLCLQKEEELIKKIGIDNLCNLTYGGESGILSKESLNKISKANSGIKSGRHGISLYTIWIEKYGIKEANIREKERIRKIKLNNIGKNKGKKHIPWNKGKVNIYTKERLKSQSKKCIGKKNPMHGRSLIDVWTEKYGLEIANEKYETWKYNCSTKSKNIILNKNKGTK